MKNTPETNKRSQTGYSGDSNQYVSVRFAEELEMQRDQARNEAQALRDVLQRSKWPKYCSAWENAEVCTARTTRKETIMSKNNEQPSGSPLASPSCSTFEDAVLQNAAVNRVMKSGGTTEDAVVVLVNQLENAMKRIVELESISPKRMTVNGRDMIWRCPDHLIPSSNDQI